MLGERSSSSIPTSQWLEAEQGVDSRPRCGDKAGDASADVGTAKNLLTSDPDTLLPIGLTRSFDAGGTGGGLNIGSVAFALLPFPIFAVVVTSSRSESSTPSGAQTLYPTTTALTYAAGKLRASPARRVRDRDGVPSGDVVRRAGKPRRHAYPAVVLPRLEKSSRDLRSHLE
ncbi:hypothetical protein K438DRAFT_1771221 [Mycena galopus ATCC 62051]|nr:hypothetical protein K438DRAFT_1771221 [Mycena galopus ATCC 62051]